MEDLFTAQPVIQKNITQAKEYTFLWYITKEYTFPLPFSQQSILQYSQTVVN